MKHYLVNERKLNSDDSSDIYFFEIWTEDQYNFFNEVKKVLKVHIGYFYLGSVDVCDSFDHEFDYLDFEPQELTDTEYDVLSHLHIIGRKLYDDFRDSLVCFLIDKDLLSLNKEYTVTNEEIIKILKENENMLDE